MTALMGAVYIYVCVRKSKFEFEIHNSVDPYCKLLEL